MVGGLLAYCACSACSEVLKRGKVECDCVAALRFTWAFPATLSNGWLVSNSSSSVDDLTRSYGGTDPIDGNAGVGFLNCATVVGGLRWVDTGGTVIADTLTPAGLPFITDPAVSPPYLQIGRVLWSRAGSPFRWRVSLRTSIQTPGGITRAFSNNVDITDDLDGPNYNETAAPGTLLASSSSADVFTTHRITAIGAPTNSGCKTFAHAYTITFNSQSYTVRRVCRADPSLGVATKANTPLLWCRWTDTSGNLFIRYGPRLFAFGQLNTSTLQYAWTWLVASTDDPATISARIRITVGSPTYDVASCVAVPGAKACCSCAGVNQCCDQCRGAPGTLAFTIDLGSGPVDFELRLDDEDTCTYVIDSIVVGGIRYYGDLVFEGGGVDEYTNAHPDRSRVRLYNQDTGATVFDGTLPCSATPRIGAYTKIPGSPTTINNATVS